MTNKNNITIAPTYTIINKNAINSKFMLINRPNEKKNVFTNQNTEWIGLVEKIHIKHEKNIKIEKIKNISFI